MSRNIFVCIRHYLGLKGNERCKQKHYSPELPKKSFGPRKLG
jgi:hypothetical protein